jgi:glycosyltransferase involved in cell wall biosynthesis
MIPKLTIVTPSYNQANYLEDTIFSVLGQNFGNLEYLIIDGGSSDGSAQIINKYKSSIHFWCSEKDKGQADAINKGFNRSTGEILGWLNSDDLYMPGTLLHIASKLDPGKSQVIFGNCLHFHQNDPEISYGSNLADRLTKKHFLSGSLIQPSTFWTKKAWEKVGPLNIDMHYAFDLEWYNRAKMAGVEFIYTPRHLSLYRIHGEHKTATGGDKRLREIARVYGLVKGLDYENAFNGLIADQEKVRKFLWLMERLKLNASQQRFVSFAKFYFKRWLSNVSNEDIRFMLYRLK